MSKRLEEFKKSEYRVTSFLRGVTELRESNVFEILREIGSPKGNPMTTTQERAAMLGMWSAGFNDALDVLLSFADVHLSEKKDASSIPLEYGGGDTAVLRGDLLEEELDAIRLGTEPDYTAIIKRERERGSKRGN